MSQKQHKKQIERAREKRQASAVVAKQRRIRVVAIVVIVAVALSLFAGALLAGRDDTGTPEVAGDVGGEGYASEDATSSDASEDPAAGAGSYDSPQGAVAEPCPTDVEAPEVTATPRDAAPEMTIDPAATYTATIETTCGTVVVELAAADAPTTVNNFVTLAREDYYVGVPFHRVINGFMVQGGDPTGTGHGDQGTYPGYTFEDELALAEQLYAANGGYPRGTLAMANSGPDTNGSQFFIVQAEPGYALPPQYAVFGHVTEGMDIVDRIAQGPVDGQLAVDPVRIIDITIEESAA